MNIKIPEKSLFKIEEICELLDIKPYVLRFWESEFSEIKPLKTANGQKVYEHKDVKILVMIKKLLMEDKMTVNKVKRDLKKKLNGCQGIQGPEKIKNIFPSKKLSKRKGQGKHLSEGNLDKLIAAKAKIEQLMKKVQSVQSRHDW